MLKFESEKNRLFQTRGNDKIIKKPLVLLLKRKTHQKHVFFLKIVKNVEKNMKTPKRFACCMKRSPGEENREESPRKSREKGAPRR